MARIIDNRPEVYQEITDQMIAMIEAGDRPCRNRGTAIPPPASRCARPAFPIAGSMS